MFKKILDVFIDKLNNALFWRVLTSSVEMDPLVRFTVEPVMVDCKIKLLVERVDTINVFDNTMVFPVMLEPDRVENNTFCDVVVVFERELPKSVEN